MKRSVNVWDVIAWVVLAGILLWLVLKTIGVINTPLLLEYAPLYGAIYLAGWQIHKLEIVARDVQNLKRFKEETVSEINKIKINYGRDHN